jgi:hypothetical protein
MDREADMRAVRAEQAEAAEGADRDLLPRRKNKDGLSIHPYYLPPRPTCCGV